MELTKETIEFIKSSPTAFNAIYNMRSILLEHGFIELKEEEPFSDLKDHQGYGPHRNNSEHEDHRIREEYGKKEHYGIKGTTCSDQEYKI